MTCPPPAGAETGAELVFVVVCFLGGGHHGSLVSPVLGLTAGHRGPFLVTAVRTQRSPEMSTGGGGSAKLSPTAQATSSEPRAPSMQSRNLGNWGGGRRKSYVRVPIPRMGTPSDQWGWAEEQGRSAASDGHPHFSPARRTTQPGPESRAGAAGVLLEIPGVSVAAPQSTQTLHGRRCVIRPTRAGPAPGLSLPGRSLPGKWREEGAFSV
jgi:hypothetical protein